MSIQSKQKSILIVSATRLEIAPLLTNFGKIIRASDNLLSYKLKGFTVDFLITGVGMVNTTYQLTKLLYKKKYGLVINAGIAGTFNEKLKIGSVANIVFDRFGDLGVENDSEFIDVFDLNLIGKKEFPYTNGTLKPSKIDLFKGLKKVKGITVNKVHGNEASIKKIQALYNPDIESMEGAAVFYCCMMENIPVAQIRSISNKVEKRNRANWNIPLAIENLNNKLGSIIEEIILSHKAN